ncbi:flavin reductase family protein [Phreatobacter stygius]|uniref:Flavin reductase family protein n=1 Tax=Phreatobacter stygius TaxID=1940610 RepID=A0A4D7BK57_9HYPH|nr:flavin reductase family protein [Phreatobacter stygius]QCI68117.1 flavin reductase family protein [Phreatobacter stygius]
MHYNVTAADHGLPYDPFKAVVAPRPIGWITALDRDGRVNCSPYSFFNAISDKPHMVAFGGGGMKDARAFIEETGEFTCSLSTFDLREEMNRTSAPLPRGEDEMAFAGLEAAPSKFVKPPRVKASPAALECKYLQTVPLTSLEGVTNYFLIIGQVLGIYIDDAFIRDGIVDTGAMRPIMRAGYDQYFQVGPEQMFKMTRPPGGGNFNERKR